METATCIYQIKAWRFWKDIHHFWRFAFTLALLPLHAVFFRKLSSLIDNLSSLVFKYLVFSRQATYLLYLSRIWFQVHGKAIETSPRKSSRSYSIGFLHHQNKPLPNMHFVSIITLLLNLLLAVQAMLLPGQGTPISSARLQRFNLHAFHISHLYASSFKETGTSWNRSLSCMLPHLFRFHSSHLTRILLSLFIFKTSEKKLKGTHSPLHRPKRQYQHYLHLVMDPDEHLPCTNGL